MVLVYDESALAKLQAALNGWQVSKARPDARELANIALKLIVAKIKVQHVLEDRNFSSDDKIQAERTIRQIAEMEKSIYRLYYISMSGRRLSKPRGVAPIPWQQR